MNLIQKTTLTILLLFQVSTLPSKVQMSDPLFAISYDPQKVHFAPPPSGLATRCPELRKTYVKAWSYGHLEASGADYFLISGMMRYHDNASGAPTAISPDETGGLVVELRANECRVDQADYFFNQQVNPARNATPIVASRSVIVTFLQRVFETYAKAFGGREKFLRQVDETAIGPPIVLEQLKQYEKASHGGNL
jgi:hypothetical protein